MVVTHGHQELGNSVWWYYIINNNKYILTRQYINEYYKYATIAENTTIYLKENSILDFSFEPSIVGIWSIASFRIYAMFE